LTQPIKKYKIWEPLLLSLVTVVGMLVGVRMSNTHVPGPKAEPAITSSRYSGRQVEEIIRFLETRYVGDVSSDELVNKAVDAIMQGLDPHTHYIPPDQVEKVEEKTMGYYVGIGVEIAFLGDSLMVLHPKKDGPAAKAGLRTGDLIMAVDNQPIINDSLSKEEIMNMIRGTKGTKVTLSVRPMISDSIRQVDIVRDEIKVPSVTAEYVIDTAIAYIRINRFTGTTYREFMDSWERMYEKEGARHLILDLRDNPGGYLSEAVNILSQFFREEGQLLVYTEGKSQQSRMEYKSTGKVYFPVDHVVILINEASASASEIIAGCIQDHDRGVVIGDRSFGKGLVQEQFNLSNGGLLRMTVSRYYTPSGRLIQKSYDSLSVVDTLAVFKTTSGRPVFAGGGILPDIQLRDDIDWTKASWGAWMDVITEYAIRYNLDKFGGEIISPQFTEEVRSNLPEDDTMLRSLKDVAIRRMKLAEPELGRFLEENKATLLRLAKASLIAYRTGEAGWYRAYNQYDPVVRKAVEIARMEPSMALSEESR
jgi:carboxyl-terminal processing protease